MESGVNDERCGEEERKDWRGREWKRVAATSRLVGGADETSVENGRPVALGARRVARRELILNGRGVSNRNGARVLCGGAFRPERTSLELVLNTHTYTTHKTHGRSLSLAHEYTQ